MRTPNTVFQNRRSVKQTRTLIVLLIVVALVGINIGPRQVVARSTTTKTSAVFQSTTVPMLAGTTQTISNSPGFETDPHVTCDMVSYTVDDLQGSLQIQYFDFATNTNHVIPGNGADSLSDVSNGRVAFTEGTPSGPQIVIFDTATQIRNVVPGFWHRRSGLGGNTVAYEDRSFSDDANSSTTPAELSVYDPSSGINAPLTNDALFDKNPAVSPSGNAVVWEKCQTNSSGCDIYSIVRIGPALFQIRALTGAGEDSGPDTNGQIAVYISDKSGENDIYYQPVDGGTELHLPIPGNQRSVSIFGNLISFESQVQLGNVTEYDIFVYDLSTGNLYQATSTPVNETLSDITICNGIGRIVYAAPAPFTEFDIYAFTFQLPSSIPNQIEDLSELLESFNLLRGTANSLMSKLQDALAAINVSDTAAACDSLTAFSNECQAQSGKKLTAAQASQLIESASEIKSGLGCE